MTTLNNSNFSPNNTVDKSAELRHLKWWEVQQLERQGCSASCWEKILVGDVDLNLIRNVEFIGTNTIESLKASRRGDCMIANLIAEECRFGAEVRVRNIGGGMHGVCVGDGATVENVARISIEPEAQCGQGVSVAVLDETGSRPVSIYAGMSSQSAALTARMPHLNEDVFIPQTEEHLDRHPLPSGIGAGAVVRDCGPLENVSIGRETRVEGAAALRNGAIINNAAPGRALAYVGTRVDAENFIIEDGRVDSGAIIRNCYIGQGATVEKGFTAHDSLIFANTQFENGEACAVFAGPYTVSMHKGSLLIGCQTSFMNAGSSTNQSNHMYKLGPVHWGLLERGVKTSSNSYLMLGARIGAFSLLMGDHKTHPDSSEFPFSYLFGDARGATVVVPAVMLRSCGLLRDEKKWPTRDRRLKRRLPLLDRVCFEVLNPSTIARILTARATITQLLKREADDDLYLRYKGMKISRASLERAKKLYALAIYKYLDGKLIDTPLPEIAEEDLETTAADWVDLAGQLMPRRIMEEALKAESIEERERIFTNAFERYDELEREWISAAIPSEWFAHPELIKRGAEEFDAIVEEDRTSYREELDAEQQMLKL
ncbi:MAG: DUF4954 family protein [Muribaculaceae bacterium]|nr:DUF4954 family protein [Muribaculaceae bacterium]